MLLWTLLAVLGHPEEYSREYTNVGHHHDQEPSRHYQGNHPKTTRGARSIRDIKCLKDCPDKALDFQEPEMVCLWWHSEGEHNCFGRCSDRVLTYMEKKIHRACREVDEMHMHGQIYLTNGNSTHTDNTTYTDNTTRMDNATYHQDNEQHYQEDYRNTTSNDTESHHEHNNYHHDNDEHHHDHDDHHHKHEDHDHEHEEHEHEHEDDMPECLKDCRFEEVDMSMPESACPWFHAEAPEHNTESCFNDCSPGVMYHIGHHIEQLCTETPEETEEEQNPFECVMDCPIEHLDPHSAESFCPWFSHYKNDTCFYDCSDDFLNMAQAHAEHTCAEYEVEGAANFTNYVNEPLVDELVHAEEPMRCPAGFYQVGGYECHVCPAAMFSYEGDYECTACANSTTSFPGAMSPEECFKRH